MSAVYVKDYLASWAIQYTFFIQTHMHVYRGINFVSTRCWISACFVKNIFTDKNLTDI